MSDLRSPAESLLQRLPLPVVIVVAVVFGSLVACWSMARADAHLRQGLLLETRLVAAAIEQERLSAFMAQGVDIDINSLAYHGYKERLHALTRQRPEWRFLYMVGMVGDEPYIAFDNVSPGDDDYATGGTDYPDAPAETWDLGPVCQRWGGRYRSLVGSLGELH